MNKLTNLLIIFLIIFSSCQTDKEVSLQINKVFEKYYQENLILYPLKATSQGDVRYNDFLPNNLTDEFRNNEKVFYSNYLDQLNKFDDNNLNEQDLLSKKVLLWECNRNLDRLSFNEQFTLPLLGINVPLNLIVNS